MQRKHVVCALLCGAAVLCLLWAAATRVCGWCADDGLVVARPTMEAIGDGKAVIRWHTTPHLLQQNTTRVMFGHTQAQVVEFNTTSIVVCVPHNAFEGIGWPVTVAVKVEVVIACPPQQQPRQEETQTTATETTGTRGVVVVEVARLEWTFKATVPPTRVANVGLLWLTEFSAQALKVVELFVSRLGNDWRFQFVVFEDIVERVRQCEVVKQLVDDGRLVLEVHKRTTRAQYAKQCVSTSFWQRVQGDRVLLFQLDSVPCSGAQHNITHFFDFDLIGAPWSTVDIGYNGGLSLRNRTLLLQLLQNNTHAIARASASSRWVSEDSLIGLSTNTPTHSSSSKHKHKHKHKKHSLPWWQLQASTTFNCCVA